MGAQEARRLIEHLGVRGFKFHPPLQAFYPNDRSAYVLYEVIAEAGLPAMFHTGQVVLERACVVEEACISSTGTLCIWMMWRSTSRICRS